jgi:hypothetical protein
VVASKLLGGELVEANIKGAQHTEYMSMLATATDEAASRHGKARRRKVRGGLVAKAERPASLSEHLARTGSQS